MEIERDQPNRIGRTLDAVTNFIIPPKKERPTVRSIGEYEAGQPLVDYVVYFAGHGAPQSHGMEKALRQLEPISDLYSSITDRLGFDLGDLSNDDLKQTEHAQPAIAGINIASCLSHELAFPDELQNVPFAASGQSAGVISAAWFAGMFGERNSRDAVLSTILIAKKRGEIMQKMHNNPPSGHMLIMAGDRRTEATREDLMAIDLIRLESLPREMSASLALDISDSRIILGGTTDALEHSHDELKRRFKDENLRYFDVPTSCVGFHGIVMEPIVNEIYEMFDEERKYMQDPLFPILTNTHRAPRLIRTVDEFVEEQVRLITEPVFGRDMSEFLRKEGIDTGLEFGERGIIAKSMDGFDITPKAFAVGGIALAIGTGYLIKRRKQ